MTLKDVIFAESRDQIIAEEAFLPILEEAASGLLVLRDKVCASNGRKWRRRFVSRLLKEVHTLRTVLNDYQAQENREYSYFMEIVAGIRGTSTAIYTLNHMKQRFLRSPLAEIKPRADQFVDDVAATVSSISGTLGKLFAAFLEECDRLGVELPPAEAPDAEDTLGETVVRRQLPHNLDEEEMNEEGEKIAQVASTFLKIAETYESVVPPRLDDYTALRRFVRTKLDEEQARALESSVHALQSKYDTYIQHTGSEGKNPDLKHLRSIISVTLHLFEVTTLLVHFYERHENDIRSQETKERISKIADKALVLDQAVNFAFRGAAWLIEEGTKIAHRLIPEYTSIRETAYRIPDHVRLHIRPAALIAAIVNHHGTPVTMRMGGNECDASSVTDVIFLAGSNLEAREVTFRGDERPLADLAVLFQVGLVDEGHAEIQRRLEYLSNR